MVLKEGYKNLLIGATVTIVLLPINSLAATIALLYTLFNFYIFRDPHIDIYNNEDIILSPVDGTVSAVDHKNGKAKIFIDISLCNKHTVLSPINSNIKITKRQNGLNLDPNTYKGSLLNEQIKFKFNDKLKLKLIGGFFNSAFSYTKKEKVEQGEKIAVFTNGTAILTIDNSFNLKVKSGDKLKSGQTAIA